MLPSIQFLPCSQRQSLTSLLLLGLAVGAGYLGASDPEYGKGVADCVPNANSNVEYRPQKTDKNWFYRKISRSLGLTRDTEYSCKQRALEHLFTNLAGEIGRLYAISTTRGNFEVSEEWYAEHLEEAVNATKLISGCADQFVPKGKTG